MADEAVSEFALTAGSSAEKEAEHALGEALTGSDSSVLDRAVLLISELITNEHGVRTFGEGDVLSVKVLAADGSPDRDPGFGHRCPPGRVAHAPSSGVPGLEPPPAQPDRRSMGNRSGADGAWVWFELDGPRRPA